MKEQEFKDTLKRIKNINVQDFLKEDGNNKDGLNPQIVIQVVDENFEYGYWDYFYKTNYDNPKWFNEFNKHLKKYLKDLKINLSEEDEDLTDEQVYNYIDDINMYVAFYENEDDNRPYAYWDCLNEEYNA